MATIVKFGGGTSKPPVAVIVVTAPTGSAVTAVCNGKSYTAAEHNGRWGIYVDALGTYTVTATRGTDSDTATVEVTREGGVYGVTLRYNFTVTITGDGRWNNTSIKAYVTIGGTRYYQATTLQVGKDTPIVLSVLGETGRSGTVTVNGVTVLTTNASWPGQSYTITPNADTTITLRAITSVTGDITADYPATATQALQIENAGLKAALHTLGVDTGEVDTM